MCIQNKVCAADGGTQLIESNVVSEYLDRKYKDQGTQLLPDDPLLLAKVSQLSVAQKRKQRKDSIFNAKERLPFQCQGKTPV